MVLLDRKYPIPQIDDILGKMQGGKYFVSLDISKAYFCLMVTAESAKLQCISTHRGSYEVNCLMPGTKTAPDIWQEFINKAL